MIEPSKYRQRHTFAERETHEHDHDLKKNYVEVSG